MSEDGENCVIVFHSIHCLSIFQCWQWSICYQLILKQFYCVSHVLSCYDFRIPLNLQRSLPIITNVNQVLQYNIVWLTFRTQLTAQAFL